MKKNIIYNIFLICAILSGSTLFAQTVTGTVSDNNGAIPGVNIIIKNTSKGTVTDFDGNYTIDNADQNAVLVFSFLGYVTKEVSINGKTVIDVVLIEDSQSLDEIVLVGYSSRKKSTLTGALAVVDVEGLTKVRTSNVAQSLQGQVAGVQVA